MNFISAVFFINTLLFYFLMLQSSGCTFLQARAVAAVSFSTATKSSHGTLQTTPGAFNERSRVTTLASQRRRTMPGMLPSPMALFEFLAPHKSLSFAVQYVLSFRFYFMFMARTTFQVFSAVPLNALLQQTPSTL